MSIESESGLFFSKPPEVAIGRVMLTPDGPEPYKVVFRLGDQVLAEHPVPTVREGEALIRRELPGIQFTAVQQRPHPHAPMRRLSSVPPEDATG
jgi:hypothetical protein